MKKLICLFLLLFSSVSFSLDDSLIAPKWSYSGVAGLNISQIALENWTQGGDNALAFTLLGNFGAKFIDSPWTFNNGLKLAFGRTKLGEDEFRTNDNEFFLESILSYAFGWALDPYFSNSVRTVLSKGYDYKINPAIQTSQFFDPGYITQSIGFMYNKLPNFTTRIGLGFQETITSKFPFYSDDPETPSELEKFKFDTGIESVTEGAVKIEENVLYGSKLRLFSSFNELDVWDVRWDNLITAQISKYFNVNFNVLLIYEKKQSLKTQLKEALQFGITYSLF
ncbi:MAG: DUF3078 domain-containing protein [Ignavibacteriaceae bacterium]|nr:DUF3078 domain-containing protein [Ignavibacteriaceae bacterium]